jgi:hypothetical protein
VVAGIITATDVSNRPTDTYTDKEEATARQFFLHHSSFDE